MILLFSHEKEKLKKDSQQKYFSKIENVVKIVKNKEYGELYYADLFSLFYLTVIILAYAQ